MLETPMAAWYDHIEAAKVLLRLKSANINSKDNGGETSLQWAVEKRNIDLVKILLESGAQRNISTGVGGNSPLGRACRLCPENTIEVLLASGSIDSELVNGSFQQAAAFPNERIVTFFILCLHLDGLVRKSQGWLIRSSGGRTAETL
jgi:ankyrin repeat protein